MDQSVFNRTLLSNYNHWWFASRRAIFYYLVKNLNLKKKIKILDYGVGTGANISILKSFSKDLSIFDVNKKMQKYLLNKYKVKIYNKKKYDLIFLTDVLEHVKNDKNLIKKLIKNLNKNGYLFITVPAYQYLFSSKDKMLHHYRRYNSKELIKVVLNKKTIIKKISYFNFFLFIPLSLIIIFFKILNIPFIDRVEKTPNLIVNFILQKIFSIEKYFLTKINLPFGLSVLAIIQKKVK